MTLHARIEELKSRKSKMAEKSEKLKDQVEPLDAEYAEIAEEIEALKKGAGIKEDFELDWEKYVESLPEERRSRVQMLSDGYSPIENYLRYDNRISRLYWKKNMKQEPGLINAFHEAGFLESAGEFFPVGSQGCPEARLRLDIAVHMAVWMLKMLADHKFVRQALDDPEFGKLTPEQEHELRKMDQEWESPEADRD